ncbi:hypothetical protein BDK51DRAFT_20949, partial [Blyttiomyces helicus]
SAESQGPAAPPDYFDVSSVPPGCCVHPEDVHNYGPSSVRVHINGKGRAVSHDSRLDHNVSRFLAEQERGGPDELWNYFLTFANRPELSIRVKGDHEETRTDHSTTTDSNGNTHTTTTTSTVTITDFNFTVDVSHLIYPEWSSIVAVPGKDGADVTVREVLEQYTRSQNQLKAIHFKKQIMWDLHGLRFAITRACRDAGFCSHLGHVHVSFNFKNDKVTARSSSALSVISQNCCVRALCVLTCCWIFALPAYLCYRKCLCMRLRDGGVPGPSLLQGVYPRAGVRGYESDLS